MDRLSLDSGVRLAVERHDDPGGVRFALTGDVDFVSSPLLDRALADVAKERPGKVVLDLSEVGFLDSSGLRTLVAGQRRLGDHGSNLVLHGPNARIRRVFELTGLDALLRTE